jgi:hypothetical protein
VYFFGRVWWLHLCGVDRQTFIFFIKTFYYCIMNYKMINAFLALAVMALTLTFCTKEQQTTIPGSEHQAVTVDERGPTPCNIQFQIFGNNVEFCGVVGPGTCVNCDNNLSAGLIEYGPGLHNLTGVATTNGEVYLRADPEVPAGVRVFINGVVVTSTFLNAGECKTLTIDGVNCTATF